MASGRGRKECREKAVQRFGDEEARLEAKTGQSLWVEIGVFEGRERWYHPEHEVSVGERKRRTRQGQLRQGLGGIRTLDFRLVFLGEGIGGWDFPGESSRW